MKSSKSIAAAAVIGIAALVAVGCSGDKPEKGVVEQQINADASAGSKQAMNQPAITPSAESPENPQVRLAGYQPTISDLALFGGKVYGIADGGLLVYDPTTDQSQWIKSPESLAQVHALGDTLYAGGDHLYIISDEQLVPYDIALPASITAMGDLAGRLVVGTEAGAVRLGDAEPAYLIPNVTINALAVYGNALWIGTDGDGLYRFNGTDAQRRFLRRDSSLFDCVTTLAGGYNHLYAGTPHGLFVYDGGSWRQFTIAEGLPSNEVLSVDASGWVVYVGTAEGTVSWFADTFTPVKGLDSRLVLAMTRAGEKVYFGTESEGLLVKVNSVVRPVTIPDAAPAAPTVSAVF